MKKTKTPEAMIAKAERELEARQEWHEFMAALKQDIPARQLFTSTAIMLVYLQLGKEALR